MVSSSEKLFPGPFSVHIDSLSTPCFIFPACSSVIIKNYDLLCVPFQNKFLFKNILFLWVLWEFHACIQYILIIFHSPPNLYSSFYNPPRLSNFYILYCYYILQLLDIMHSTRTQNLTGREGMRSHFPFASRVTRFGYFICFPMPQGPLFWSEGINSTHCRVIMKVQWNMYKALIKYFVYSKCSGQ